MYGVISFSFCTSPVKKGICLVWTSNTVKKSKYPGRPPSGCAWVKKGDALKTNDEVAYRKLKPSELKAKK
jgi:hypothetical protein